MDYTEQFWTKQDFPGPAKTLLDYLTLYRTLSDNTGGYWTACDNTGQYELFILYRTIQD